MVQTYCRQANLRWSTPRIVALQTTTVGGRKLHVHANVDTQPLARLLACLPAAEEAAEAAPATNRACHRWCYRSSQSRCALHVACALHRSMSPTWMPACALHAATGVHPISRIIRAAAPVVACQRAYRLHATTNRVLHGSAPERASRKPQHLPPHFAADTRPIAAAAACACVIGASCASTCVMSHSRRHHLLTMTTEYE